MIGGIDIHLNVPDSAVALDFALRLIRHHWLGAVFIGESSSTPVTRYEDLELHADSEIIVYRDMATCQGWRELGYDESLKGTMMYLIAGAGVLTIVIEHDPPNAILSIVEQIKIRLPSAQPWPLVARKEAA